jgi:hypothetical protein
LASLVFGYKKFLVTLSKEPSYCHSDSHNHNDT